MQRLRSRQRQQRNSRWWRKILFIGCVPFRQAPAARRSTGLRRSFQRPRWYAIWRIWRRRRFIGDLPRPVACPAVEVSIRLALCDNSLEPHEPSTGAEAARCIGHGVRHDSRPGWDAISTAGNFDRKIVWPEVGSEIPRPITRLGKRHELRMAHISPRSST
jgi:hypothetical protein